MNYYGSFDACCVECGIKYKMPPLNLTIERLGGKDNQNSSGEIQILKHEEFVECSRKRMEIACLNINPMIV